MQFVTSFLLVHRAPDIFIVGAYWWVKARIKIAILQQDEQWDHGANKHFQHYPNSGFMNFKSGFSIAFYCICYVDTRLTFFVKSIKVKIILHVLS